MASKIHPLSDHACYLASVDLIIWEELLMSNCTIVKYVYQLVKYLFRMLLLLLLNCSTPSVMLFPSEREPWKLYMVGGALIFALPIMIPQQSVTGLSQFAGTFQTKKGGRTQQFLM